MNKVELDHRRLATFTFALIDPLQGNDAALSGWESFVLHPLVPQGFAAQTDEFPKLVDLTKIQAHQREALIALLLGQSPIIGSSLCVALLDTSTTVERLSVHLRHLLAPSLPQHRRGVFRFYDPVVMEHLSWMLDTRNLASLFGRVNDWLLPARGAWYRLTCPNEPTAPATPFHTNPATWQRITRIGAIHAVLEQLPQWRDAPAEFGPLVETQFVRAEHHRLVDRTDLVAFASHGLLWHPQFDKHPRVNALLAECIDHPCRYHRLAGLWTPSDWQAMADDLEQRTPSHPTRATASQTSQGMLR